jgi:hypothetical protein
MFKNDKITERDKDLANEILQACEKIEAEWPNFDLHKYKRLGLHRRSYGWIRDKTFNPLNMHLKELRALVAAVVNYEPPVE